MLFECRLASVPRIPPSTPRFLQRPTTSGVATAATAALRPPLLVLIHPLGVHRKTGAPFAQQCVIGMPRFAETSRRSRFVCDSAELVNPLRHLDAITASREFRPPQRELLRDVSRTVDARNCRRLLQEGRRLSGRAWNRRPSTK